LKTAERWILSLTALLPLAFIGLFYLYPMGSIFNYSLGNIFQGAEGPLFRTFSAAKTWDILGFTFWQAILSTLFTLLLGMPGAFLFGRYRFRGKGFLKALTAIPFVMPTLVVAAAFNALLGPRGWVNQGFMQLFALDTPPVQFMNSLWAIITAHVFYNTTIILRTVGDFWSRLDPKLEQAARSLGANRAQVLLKVTLPLISPAVAAASLLVFIFDFTSFGVILILGGPQFSTLEVEIFTQSLHYLNLTQAAALSVIQLLCTFAFTLIYQHLSSRLERPLTLKATEVTFRTLSNWKIRILAGSFILLLLIFLVTPLVSLALRSVVRIDRQLSGQTQNNPISLSLEYYQELNQNRRQSFFYASPSSAITLSLSYAVSTVVLALFLGIPAALALTRIPNFTFSRLIDTLLFLPLGTSSVTLGLGFILALGRSPLDLRTSPLLIPIAHTLVALPFVVRNLVPALRSIQIRLHQAASNLGASPIQVIRWIDFPLASRAILTAATYAFTISIGEFGATAMISRPEYPTIPIAIYRFLGQPGAINYGQALALSTILMIVCGGGMFLIEKIRLPEQSEF
jgi:thiamine transport system permease protein